MGVKVESRSIPGTGALKSLCALLAALFVSEIYDTHFLSREAVTTQSAII